MVMDTTGMAKQTADNARPAKPLAADAREDAGMDAEGVSGAVWATGASNPALQTIADLVGVIDELALQTGLLALNAAMEAARTGEQGRGFAVVASEIRDLAQRSAGTAMEFNALLDDPLATVEAGSRPGDASDTTLQGIVPAVRKVSDLIAAIAAAAQAHAAEVGHVNEAIIRMDQSTLQNAAPVEEAAEAAESMDEQSWALPGLRATFATDEAGGSTGSRWPPGERRGPGRPWSAPDPQRGTAPATANRRVQATGDDADRENDLSGNRAGPSRRPW